MFCLFCCVWVGCTSTDTSKLDKIASPTKPGVDRLEGVEAYYSDSAKVVAKMNAPLMYLEAGEKPKRQFPKGLDVEFYATNGDINCFLHANKAERDEQSGLVLLTDSVLIKNIKGETLKTNQLYWDDQKQSLYNTDEYVEISTPDGQLITGYGMVSNKDFTNWSIKRVTAPRIKSQGLMN